MYERRVIVQRARSKAARDFNPLTSRSQKLPQKYFTSTIYTLSTILLIPLYSIAR